MHHTGRGLLDVYDRYLSHSRALFEEKEEKVK
jgi:hypothetical protein